MATIRLIPSTYYLSNSSYLSVSNASNMYDNADSTTYATVTNSRSSTTSYYVYVRGFNFDDVPSNAIVNSFTIKIKCSYSGGYAQAMYLYDGTSTSFGSSDSISSTVETHTFTCNRSWEDVVAAGSDFGIRINCRRSNRNTAAYVYIYGAEIEVDYTIPTPRSLSVSVTGEGTVSPSGSSTVYDGDEVEITITPTTKTDTVTATHNGVDITSQLVAHGVENTMAAVPDDVTTNGIQSGEQYAEYAVGYSAESPTSQGSSSNMYSPNGSTGYAEYSFDLSGVPSGATIESVEATCYGHRESATIDSTHVSSVGIYKNGTLISDTEEFQTTSNSTIVVAATSSLSQSDLSSLTLRHYVGYYGGLVLGITLVVTYSTGSGLDHYTYTYVVDGDATIAVVIGGTSTPPTISIGTPDKLRISDESGYDECTCVFTADQTLVQWEARAVKNGVTPQRGVGVLVESGTNLAAGAQGVISVLDEELTSGDGTYLIAVYGQNSGGQWNE